jgi:hypothetical protein
MPQKKKTKKDKDKGMVLPCERFVGLSIYVKGEIFDSCFVNPQCPKCKYREK